jgi:hypothetical protein
MVHEDRDIPITAIKAFALWVLTFSPIVAVVNIPSPDEREPRHEEKK